MPPWRSLSKLKCFQAFQLVTATRNVGVRPLSFHLLIFPTATPDLQPTAAGSSPLGPERGSSVNMSTDVEEGSSHHTKQLCGLGVKYENMEYIMRRSDASFSVKRSSESHETASNLRFSSSSLPAIHNVLSSLILLWTTVVLASITIDDPSDVTDPSLWAADSAIIPNYDIAMIFVQPSGSELNRQLGLSLGEINLFTSRNPQCQWQDCKCLPCYLVCNNQRHHRASSHTGGLFQ